MTTVIFTNSNQTGITPFAHSDELPVTLLVSVQTIRLFLRGQIDIDAALKNSRFIRFCNLYNIPMLFVEDTTGFLPGRKRAEVLRRLVG